VAALTESGRRAAERRALRSPLILSPVRTPRVQRDRPLRQQNCKLVLKDKWSATVGDFRRWLIRQAAEP
jgi:hypothetical protein